MRKPITMKTKIIEKIGEYNLLLPFLVQKALIAGDQSRYYLNLLTTAIDHADNPDIKKDSLIDLRIRTGIVSDIFDTVVFGSTISPEGIYQIPYFDKIITGLSNAILDMVSPFRPETFCSCPQLFKRAQSLLLVFSESDSQITQDDGRINVLHEDYDGENFIRLIREIEEMLIPLQEKMTPEEVYGATTYLVEPEDMFLIRSFMIGLNRTELLRFDHPGLGTSVIRAGNSLLIQNEIGMTDANILILQITGLHVTIRYTDVHINRLSFFQRLMDPYPVLWGELLSRNNMKGEHSELLHLSTGFFSARSGEDLLMFISHLSSQIVFLIEWNRARKALKPFLFGSDVLKVLHKAVKREVGHRAFLILGGERLIYDALEDSSEISLKYGEILSDVLGSDYAIEFCISVLEISTQYMRQTLPRSYIRDDIRAELMRQFMSGREDLHHAYVAYAGKVRTLISLFTLLSSTLSDADPIKRNEIESEIRECSIHLDSSLKVIRARVAKDAPDNPWVHCISTVNKAMMLLSEAGYLCTLIPDTGVYPDIAREISQLSEYNECAADILYQAVEEGDQTPSWNENHHKEMKRYAATISQITISCDVIFRSAQKKMYTSENPGSERFITFEICRIIRDSIRLLISGSAYIRGEHSFHQLRPHLRFSFNSTLSPADPAV